MKVNQTAQTARTIISLSVTAALLLGVATAVGLSHHNNKDNAINQGVTGLRATQSLTASQPVSPLAATQSPGQTQAQTQQPASTIVKGDAVTPQEQTQSSDTSAASQSDAARAYQVSPTSANTPVAGQNTYSGTSYLPLTGQQP